MLTRLIEVLCCASAAIAATPSRDLLHIGGQGINLWKLHSRSSATGLRSSPELAVQSGIEDPQASRLLPLEKKYPASFFEQPIDHNDTAVGTFKQRYWIDDRFYEPGGPVFVLDGGETSGADRLPFLDHGILAILSNATGGLSIVLEHRYYGESNPVDEFTTDSLRWLTNEQALEDSARFMRNFNYSGIDLSATNTPWIYYGGSYAGARAAHMRVLYPDLVYGAIASSAVTHAAIDYSDYFEVIRRTNNQTCVEHIVSAVATIDRVLDIPLMSNPLKALFGLQGLKHDDDFVSVLVEPLGAVQEQNWDPAESTDKWTRFCETVSAGGAGTQIGFVKIPAEVVNYANWIRKEVVSQCPEGMTVEECFGTYDDSKFRDDTSPSSWKAWTFQVCNTWGYFMPAPSDPEQPSLLSRRITLEYTSKICAQAFPPGKHHRIPPFPRVEDVNRLGDYALESDRLAFIDGTSDPWLAATPHSWHASPRKDTVLRPFKLIRGGVHHWDENGLEEGWKEPGFIRRIHREEVAFVREWLRQSGRV